MKSIRIPFQFDGGKLSVTSSPDTIARQKILDVLNTMRYERVLRHNYGAQIQTMLFEPIDDLMFADFKTEAMQTLAECVSRVQVLDMYVVKNSPQQYYSSESTTVTLGVIYKLPLAAPKLVTLNIAVPGALNEDTPI